jgi:hypothetical protein
MYIQMTMTRASPEMAVPAIGKPAPDPPLVAVMMIPMIPRSNPSADRGRPRRFRNGIQQIKNARMPKTMEAIPRLFPCATGVFT